MKAEFLMRQMQSEEKLYGQEIGRAITLALNGRAIRAQADEINQTSGGWPYDPTAEMMQLYQEVADKTWDGMKSGYGHVEVEIKVSADKGKPPIATATAKYKGEFRGGKSYMLDTGDTIVSIAKETYGYESYAKAIWEANANRLGSQCKVLPAGFGIELPQIWVPEWKSPPKESVPSGATSRAVKIMYPAVEFDVETKTVETFVFEVGIGTVEITLELSGSLKAQMKGTMDASFNLRTYEGEISKSLGPLSGSYKMDFKEGKGKADLAVSNSGVPGLAMSTTIKLAEGGGGFKVSFGSKKVSYEYKGVTFEGSVKLSAEIRILPRRQRQPVREPVRLTAPKLTREQQQAVINVVIVAGTLAVVAAVCVGSVGSGCALAGAAGAALIVTQTAEGKGGGGA